MTEIRSSYISPVENPIKSSSLLARLWLGEIPCLRHFVWVPQPADTDCMISIEFYLELLNHVSEIWEVLSRGKYTDKLAFSTQDISFF